MHKCSLCKGDPILSTLKAHSLESFRRKKFYCYLSLLPNPYLMFNLNYKFPNHHKTNNVEDIFITIGV